MGKEVIKREGKRGKKKLGLFLILLFILLSFLIKFGLGYVHSNDVVNLWNTTINGLQNNSDSAYGIAIDNNSNIYVVGRSAWTAINPDIYIGKFNSSGSNLWNTTLNGLLNGADSAYGIAIDPNNSNNIYVVGSSRWSSVTDYDIYLGRFNSSGSNLWNTTLNGLQNLSDEAFGVAVDNNSNIYVVGYSYWSSATYADIYIGKFNSSGSNLWNTTLNGLFQRDDYGRGIALDNNSNIYITGNVCWGSTVIPDLYLGKFNSSGSNLWNSTLRVPSSTTGGQGVVLDSSRNIYVVGSYSISNSDIYLGKFNSSGSNLWNATTNGTLNSNDYGSGIALDNNSNIYVVGYSYSTTTQYPTNITLGKFNSSGSGLWNTAINGPQRSMDEGHGIALGNNSSIYIVGHSYWSSNSTIDIYFGKFYEPLFKLYNCSNCSDCSSAIADASSGDTILLNNSITTITNGTCIDFGGKNNLTFDCQSYSNFIQGANNTNTSNYGIYLNGSSNNKIRNCNLSEFYQGIYLVSSSTNNTLTNIISSYNYYSGIYLYSSSTNNNLINITANLNIYHGIGMQTSGYNTLTNITPSNNSQSGIYFYSSSSNNLSNIVSNSNRLGLSLTSSSYNLLINISANYNTNQGISLGTSSIINIFSNISIQDNILSDLGSDASSCRNSFQNITGSGERPIEFYNSTVVIENKTLSELILCGTNNSRINNITIQGSDTIKNNMLAVYGTINVTISNINSSDNYYGIYLYNNNGSTINNVTANFNNQYGLDIYSSSHNILTNVVANNNSQYGVYLPLTSINNTIINAIANSNQEGIEFSGGIVGYAPLNNTFINLTANYNNYGIYFYNHNSANNLIVNSTAQENLIADVIFNIFTDSCNNTFQNVTGSGGRPIELYTNASIIQNKVLSQLILCAANNSIINNVTIQGSDNLYNNFLEIYGSGNVTISNVNSSNNYQGILVWGTSPGNIFTNIITNSNNQSGVYLSSNNILSNITSNLNLIGITFSNNNTLVNSSVQNNFKYGLYIQTSNNTLYNNFLNNTINYYNASAGLVNFFNTTKTAGISIIGSSYIGGNFWATPTGNGSSETCTVDAEGDKICDIPYSLDGFNYDYLPLFLTLYAPSVPQNETDGTPSGGGSLPTTNQTFNPSTPTEILINNSQLDLTKIIINVLEAISGASFSVTKIDIPNINEEIGMASGKLYQAFNITAKGITNDKIKNVTIDFKVNKTWLSQNNGTSSDIRLYRKENSSANWNILLTTLKNQDDNYYHYSAFSPGFSTFVVFFGKYDCQPGVLRCYSGQTQLCLGNSTWLITEKCKFGCENGKCIRTAPQSVIIYTLMIAIISVAIIITSYLILAKIKKKK